MKYIFAFIAAYCIATYMYNTKEKREEDFFAWLLLIVGIISTFGCLDYIIH